MLLARGIAHAVLKKFVQKTESVYALVCVKVQIMSTAEKTSVHVPKVQCNQNNRKKQSHRLHGDLSDVAHSQSTPHRPVRARDAYSEYQEVSEWQHSRRLQLAILGD